MRVELYTRFRELSESGHLDVLTDFCRQHAAGNFFQAPAFFEFAEQVPEYSPFQLLAFDKAGAVKGALLGVFQSNGNGLKSWLSRRLIAWGGPLVSPEGADATAEALLKKLVSYARTRAIYVEFRNFFDTASLRSAFRNSGFEFNDHLNFLVRTDEEQAVRRRMSKSRWRQINSTRKAGAAIAEAASEGEVLAFYEILSELYRTKVKKPLPGPDFFLTFWKSGIGKLFLVKREAEVLGGILCPIFEDQVIYEWYICGQDGMEKGLYPSVLATWAPIEYACRTGLHHFDFMGAGKPEEDYGVRDFKARFGGEEVAFGRYQLILNKPLYEAGKLGLSLYQKIT